MSEQRWERGSSHIVTWNLNRFALVFCYSLFTIHFSLLFGGCGYKPVGTIPSAKSLAVIPFTNATFRPHLQAAIASAVLGVLRRDPRIALAEEKAADLLLEGTIAAYANDGIGFDRNDIARRFRVRIFLQAVLKERKSGAILAKEELVGEAFYTAGAEVVATQAAEKEAMARAALDLAERVHLLIITGLTP